MEQKESGIQKTPIQIEKEKQIEAFAAQVEENLKGKIAGKQFTVNHTIPSDRYTQVQGQVTVIENTHQKGQALWDSQVLDSLFVRESGADHGTVIFFSKLLRTPEAAALMSTIMRQKNVPADLQGEVRKKILANNPTAAEEAAAKKKK